MPSSETLHVASQGRSNNDVLQHIVAELVLDIAVFVL